jgi:type IV secretion system protein VirB1
MFIALVLSQSVALFLNACAPQIGAQTMAGIVQHESGWKPWTIGDNTTRRAYYEQSEHDVIVRARALLAQGDNLDTGLAQVNSDNFAAYGLTIETAFNPCRNVAIGAKILAGDYNDAIGTNWTGRPIATASEVYEQEQQALIHALSAYNSGKFWASMKYASDVYSIASHVQIQTDPNRMPTVTAAARQQANQTSAQGPEPSWKLALDQATMAWTAGLTVASAPRPAGPQHVRHIYFRPSWNDTAARPSAARLLTSK